LERKKARIDNKKIKTWLETTSPAMLTHFTFHFKILGKLIYLMKLNLDFGKLH